MDQHRHQTVDVGGVAVADATVDDVIRIAATPAVAAPRLVYALHVGGLLDLDDRRFRRALDDADLLYADGAAVVALGRLGGARDIARAPTTDIGVPIIAELGRRLGRPARVALVGGPPGLADRAAAALTERVGVEIVLTHDGYFDDDAPVLAALGAARPDLVVVGLGMPREALWTTQHREAFGAAVIVTCGGWFGFLAGEESRAPRMLQRIGLEWAYRLQQDFGRLVGRYAIGALMTAALVPHQLMRRFRAARRTAIAP